MGWVVFFIWCVLATVTATLIGFNVKGRPLTGFLLGIFLGWVGVLVIALLPKTAEKKVQYAMRDRAIALEAERRRAGAEPWTAPLPGREQQPLS